MEEYHTGCCKFCGQMITLAHPQKTQNDADDTAAILCKCDAGKKWRSLQQAKKQICALFSEAEEEVQKVLLKTAQLTAGEMIPSGSTIKVTETTTAKFILRGHGLEVRKIRKVEDGVIL